MEGFVIHRRVGGGEMRDRESVESRLIEVLRAIDTQMFLKKLVQFRHEYSDCDFDSEINACKLFYLKGEKQKVVQIMEEIRRKMLKYGENLLIKRMEAEADLGELGRLPQDVMRLILQ